MQFRQLGQCRATLTSFKIGPGARGAFNFNCLRTPNQLFGENQLMGGGEREQILRLLRGGLKRDERDSMGWNFCCD